MTEIPRHDPDRLAMRWQERLGGDIWMDTTQMIGHRGPMTVWGRFSDTLP